MLNKKQVNKIFHETNLEDNYNFLEDDLVKLANAFIKAAKPMIVREELNACAEIVGALNPAVGDKLLSVRIPIIREMESQ